MHGHMLVVVQHILGTIFGGDASQLVLVLEFLSGDHFWWGCWKTCALTLSRSCEFILSSGCEFAFGYEVVIVAAMLSRS